MKVRWCGSPENYFLSFILVNKKLIGSGPNLYMLKLIINVSISMFWNRNSSPEQINNLCCIVLIRFFCVTFLAPVQRGWYCYHPYTGCIVFSSVRLFVRMFVCQHDNSWTVRDIIAKFSGYHPMVERADKFKNGYIGMRGSWFNASDVLVF